MSEQQPPGGPSSSSSSSSGPSSSSSSSSGSSSSGSSEPVGSVGEEAAKLFAALSDWAREQGPELGNVTDHLSHTFAEVNDHIATGSEDCRYCPVCQVIHAVRVTSPEVKAHLAVAASSLMQAAAGVLASHGSASTPKAPMEKIDLEEDDGDWEDE